MGVTEKDYLILWENRENTEEKIGLDLMCRGWELQNNV